jgi:hypothetical protein
MGGTQDQLQRDYDSAKERSESARRHLEENGDSLPREEFDRLMTQAKALAGLADAAKFALDKRKENSS